MMDETARLTAVQNDNPYCEESQTRFQTLHVANFEI